VGANLGLCNETYGIHFENGVEMFPVNKKALKLPTFSVLICADAVMAYGVK